MSESDDATASLYQWAGGVVAIRRLMDCFYDRVENDELLSPYFPGGVSKQHRVHVTAWWSEVLGGPARYSEELGGYEGMVAHHRGLAITPEQRFRFASLLSLAVVGRDGFVGFHAQMDRGLRRRRVRAGEDHRRQESRDGESAAPIVCSLSPPV